MTNKTNKTNSPAIDNNKIYSPGDIATMLDVDAKTIRRAIRSIIPVDAHPGRGGAWRIKGDMIDAIKSRIELGGAGRVVTIDASMIKSDS